MLCRKSQDRERDLKLLLDMYKSVSKDTREKAQVSVFRFRFISIVAQGLKITSKINNNTAQ